MESAIKELNYRIKGTEKFWSKGGGEFVLQLKSDGLSSSDPLSTFWAHLLLQTRSWVLNGELSSRFRKWYPHLEIVDRELRIAA